MSDKKGFDVDEAITRVKDKMKRNMVVTGLVGAFVLAGGGYWVAWAMWGAAMGLAGLILAAVLAAIPFFGAVPFFNWLEVKKIDMIKKIAEANPISTQWALWAKDEKKVNEFSKTLDEYNTGIHSYDTDIDAERKNLSAERFQERKAEVAMMKEDLSLQRGELAKQQADLVVWERLIQEMESEWNLSIKRNKLNEKLLGLQRQEFTDRIRNDASLRAVRDSIAQRRAQIENSMHASRARAAQSGVTVQALPNNPSDVIEMAVTQTTKVAQ